MRSNIQLFLLAAASASIGHTNAFSTQGLSSTRKQIRQKISNIAVFMTPEEERAAVLSEYLAKSHDEKLGAVRSAELKKDAEIRALKNQLKILSSGQPTLPNTDISNLESLTKEELVNLVKQYLQLGPEVPGTGDETKPKAKSAPAPPKPSADKSDAGPAPSKPSPLKVTTTFDPNELYLQRNAKLAEAAAAGKSRWGDPEIQRAKDVNSARVVTSNTEVKTKSVKPVNGASVTAGKTPAGAAIGGSSAPSSLYQQRNNNVIAAAKAGKSRWGEMEINKIQSAPEDAAPANSAKPAASSTPATTSDSLYEQRNANVLAAASAGKGRWGEQEIKKVQSLSEGTVSAPAPPTTAVKPAASTVSTSASKTAAPIAPSSSSSLYEQRNAKVLEAATAGKTRWGEKEIQRIQQTPSISASAPVAAAAAKTSTPSAPDSVYEKRNANVAAAAAAGKSRWGDKEVEKVQQTPSMVSTTPGTSSDSLYEQRNAKIVAAASAGNSRWGDKEIERIQQTPSISASAPVAEKSHASDSVYEERNANVVAAAKAGKSRWGDEEIVRIQNTPVSAPAVAASVHAPDSVYDKRNANVAAAAAAGKSRWGEKEVKKILTLKNSNGREEKLSNVREQKPTDSVNLGAKILNS